MKIKKKIRKEYIIILILLIILASIIYMYCKKMNNNYSSVIVDSSNSSETSTTSSSSTTTTSIEIAEIQTITNTLSSSGEITSALTENLELHSTYYFEEIYYQVGDSVSKGEKILKYTNGTYLVAPYNLVIEKFNLPKEGSECTNSNYITVDSTDTLEITASIDEDNLNLITVGKEGEITISSLNNQTYNGYVTKISEVGNYSSNGSTFDVTITFENDGNILIGMSASCKIILEKAENVITVPIEAVSTADDNSKYVTIVNDNGETEQRTVTTGISNNAYIEITSGISEGEKVQIVTSKSTKSNSFNKNSSSSGMDFSGGQMQGKGDMSSSSQQPPSMPSEN